MIDISVVDTGDPLEIRIRGSITFATAEELHQSLLRALPKQGSLRVILEELQEFDLTGVQLLYSLCRTGESAGIAIEVVLGDAAPRFERMLRFAGLAPIPCAV